MRRVSTTRINILPVIRLRVRRQIKRYHNFYTDISTHIEYARLNASWYGWVVKIFEATHIRLVILVTEVGSFYKYF